MALDIYQTITDQILGLLERGTVPWRQPIRRTHHGDGFPKSLTTKRPYRGINVFLLAATSWLKGYESNYWATFDQVVRQGGQIRRGEKSSLVVFWKRHTVEDQETQTEKEVPVIRYYRVFNADQCERLTAPDRVPPEENLPPFEPIAAAEQIVSGYPDPPQIEQAGSSAFYRPKEDLVRIPQPERFVSGEQYYATLFHELCHSTGHEKRLARDIGTRLSAFGSADYSKEELVAELGSAFLAATAGISPPTIEQSAAYIDGWHQRLTGDKKLIVHAAGQAQRAADHILAVTFGEAGDAQEGSGNMSSAQAERTTAKRQPEAAEPQF